MADMSNTTMGSSTTSSRNASSSFKSGAMSSEFSNTPHYAGVESDSTASFMTRGMDAIQPVLRNISTRVTANPWLGVGVTAVACFGIGYLLGRRLVPTSTSSIYADRPLSESMGIATTF